MGIHLLHKDAYAGIRHTGKIKCAVCGPVGGSMIIKVMTNDDPETWDGDESIVDANGEWFRDVAHDGDAVFWINILTELDVGHVPPGALPFRVDTNYEDHGNTFWVVCDE